MNQAMGIICANYTTDRLRALTENRPLGAVPFGGRYRLLDFALSNLVNAGIRTVGIITPYLYRAILDHLGAGKEWFLDRKRGGLFILPGSISGFKNMTTKFSLRDMVRNRDYLQRDVADYVVIASANQIYNLDCKALLRDHAASGADITLVYQPEAEKRLPGLLVDVSPQGRVARLLSTEEGERQGVNGGLFADVLVIGREQLLDFLQWYQAVEHLDLMEVIEDNLNHLQVRGYPFTGYLARVNSIDTYLACSMDLLRPEVRQELFMGERPVYTKVKDSPPTRYTHQAQVVNSLVPNGCIIRGRVENSIIFHSVVVEEGAVIRDSVIMQRGSVGPNAVLEHVIADKFSAIGGGTVIKGRVDSPVVLRKRSVM